MTMDEKKKEPGLTLFSWNEFPVQKDKFCICICTKNDQSEKEKDEINRLINFVKIIFPEKNTIYNDSYDIINYKKNNDGKNNDKSTLILDLKHKTKWVDNLYIHKQYIDSGYFIIFGEYDKIPKVILTTSDIIIFDTEDTCNKYLGERHKSNISNFNTDMYYILVDKRRMGFNIHGMSKSDLNRYN